MCSVCSDPYSLDMNMWHSLEQLSSLSVPICLSVGFICSQIVPAVLNYEKQQPGGMLNFQNNHSFLNPSAHPALNQMERNGESEERMTDKQSTNKTEGATERLCYACC